METLVQLDFLNNNPGYLVYHLVISLSLIWTGSLALNNMKKSQPEQSAKQVLIGCLVLLGIQVGSFAFQLIEFNTPVTNSVFGIIFNDLINILILVWLFWMFIETGRRLLLTGVCIFLSSILVVIAAIFIFLHTISSAALSINLQTFHITWLIFSLIFIIAIMIILTIKNPRQMLVGAAIFLVLAAGFSLQIVLAYRGNLSTGVVRMAQMISIPWILMLVQRFSEKYKHITKPFIENTFENTNSKFNIKAELIQQLLDINLFEDITEKHQAVAHVLSLGAAADICYIVQITDNPNKFALTAGYDLIREVYLEPALVDREDLLHIWDSWHDGRTLIIDNDDSDTRDAFTLAMLINFHRIGSLFACPLIDEQQVISGGILLLSPYTNKRYGEETSSFIESIQASLGEIIFTPSPVRALKIELEQTLKQISQLYQENEEIKAILAEKIEILSQQKTSFQELRANYQIDKFASIKKIEQLKQELENKSVDGHLEEKYQQRLEQLNTEIRQLIKQRDQLKTLLMRANNRIKDLELQTGQTGPIRLSMDTQIVSLDSIAANARLKINAGIQEKQLDLQINNPDGRQMIKTDPELLQTALGGLLINAILTSGRKSDVLLSLALSFETGMLILEVTDHGDGLSEEEQKELFNAQKEILPGIGSVPAIREAIRAIRVLSGKLWLRSKKGQFTTFRVQLPVRIID